MASLQGHQARQRVFIIDNLLVQVHFIIEMIWWTGLAPWDFEFSFPGSLISISLGDRAPIHFSDDGFCTSGYKGFVGAKRWGVA